MGIVSKGAKCGVQGCGEDGSRSISSSRIANTEIAADTSGKKVVLCKTHYKEYKKQTKGDRDLERARYDRS